MPLCYFVLADEEMLPAVIELEILELPRGMLS